MSGFSPSLNRVMLGNFPDLPLKVTGTRSDSWLASWGIARRMSEQITQPDLPPIPSEMSAEMLSICSQYPKQLNKLVEARNAQALLIASELGMALASLIATLVLAPADAKAARPEWPESHWQRWQKAKRIAVGGGVFSGTLGHYMIAEAQKWLGIIAPEVNVFITSHAAHLPLRGAAVGLPDGPVALMDAGYTNVKRGFGELRNGSLYALTIMDSVPAPHGTNREQLFDFLADEAVKLIHNKSQSVGLSLATYIDETGQPLPNQSDFYGRLGEIQLVSALKFRLQEILQREININIVHDGTSAARAIKSDADAAIVFGTSIGSGLNVPISKESL